MGKVCILSNYDYPGIVASLTARGWDVVSGDRYNWSAWCWGNVAEVPADSPQAFGEFLVSEARKRSAALVILGKGLDSNRAVSGLEPPYWHVLPETVKRVKETGAVVVQLDFDSPDSFGFVTNCGLASAVDAIGTCCIGTREFYKRHTTADVFEFWPAWDQVLRTPPPRAPVVDLVLVGTPYVAPNADFGLPRRAVVQAALDLGLSVEVYGPDWDNEERGGHPSLAPHWRGLAPWDTLHHVLARGKVTYNSFLRQGFRYLNDRPPIAAGAGAFVLMEQQLGLDGEFPEGTMCGYHQRNNVEDLKARLRWWVDNDAAREKAALAMQAHVLAHHTYVQRAAVIESAFVAAERRNAAARATACCGRGGSKN